MFFFFCTFNLNTEPSEVKYKLRVLVFTSVVSLTFAGCTEQKTNKQQNKNIKLSGFPEILLQIYTQSGCTLVRALYGLNDFTYTTLLV